MLLGERVQLVDHLFRPLRIVDLFVVGRSQDGHDVTGAIPAVGAVGEQGRAHRLAALVVEPALGHVLAQVDAVDAAADTQRDHETDDDVSVPIYGSTPPGEHSIS